MDPSTAAQQLLQNQKFVELFQRALGETGKDGSGTEGLLASMPKEGDPKREEWLRSLQARLQEETTKEAKKDLEQVHSDENGQWMFVLPEPGFCFKTNVAGGAKVFINVCQHARIAEPVPMEMQPGEESGGGGGGEVRYRIPISCGQARPDKDKSGKPCKVYDVIVNPSTIQRCHQDNEFRRFAAALCMQWIKQKSEPTLNADEFRNLNFKCKGTLEPQRIRLSATPKDPNAMGDEIKLPTHADAATAPSQLNGAQGTGTMVQEVEPSDTAAGPAPQPTTAPLSTTPAAPLPAVQDVVAEGSYDWTTHKRAALNPYFKENVPARYTVSLFLPNVQSIREVDLRVHRRQIDCVYIDEALDGGDGDGGGTASAPFLSATLDYPVSDDVVEAKYVRKTHTLRLRVAVQLPDETQTPATRPERDVTECEEEEQRHVEAARQKAWAAAMAQREQQEKEEAAVMRERQSYVENLSAVQVGDIPPVVREEVDAMPHEQLPGMLHRLEGRVRKGDSVDALLDKLPETMLDALVDYIREKLSLEPRPKRAAATAKGDGETTAADATNAATDTASVKPATTPASPAQEFNVTKQSETLFGVAFHNRYLFALD